MIEINGKIDMLDFQYMYHRRKEEPIMAVPCPRKNGKIHPQTTRLLWKNGQMTDVVHVKPIYYENVDGKFYPMSDISYGFGNHWIKFKEDFMDRMTPRYLMWLQKRMGFISGSLSIPYPYVGIQPRQLLFNATVTTVYPDPDAETTTVDGHTQRGSVNENWATIRAGAGNSSSGSLDSFDELGSRVSTEDAAKWRTLKRGIILFDASAIDDADTLDSAIGSIYVVSVDDNITPTSGIMGYRWTTSNPGTNTTIVNADYSLVGTAQNANADIAIGSLTLGAYNDYTLNPTGEGNVSFTTVSKFGFITSRDGGGDGDEPTGSHSVGQQSDIDASTADDATGGGGTDQDPKLAITHSTPGISSMRQLTGHGQGTR